MGRIQGAALAAMVAIAASAPQPVLAVETAGPDQVEQARRMIVEARSVAEAPDGYADAAQLYRRAARLFGEHPEAAEAWASAGRLAYYIGSDDAIRDFHRAGELALAFGDVGLSAQSFLDGAFVAGEHGETKTARKLVDRAAQLVHSPYLGDNEKDRLLARLDGHTAGFRG